MSLTITVEEFSKELDLMDEEEQLASLEASVCDLHATMEHMLSIEGVSRSMVEAHSEVVKVPGGLNGFTTSPTKVNYEIALEALEDHSNAIIGAIIVLIGAILAKIVGWLLDLFLNNSKTQDKVDQVSKNTGAVSDSTERVVDAVEPEIRREVQKQLDPVKDQYQKEFDSMFNRFAEGVVLREGFHRALVSLAEPMSYEINLVNEAIDMYIKSLKEAERFVPSGLKHDLRMQGHLSRFNSLIDEPVLPRLQSAFADLYPGIEKIDSEEEFFRILKQHYVEETEAPAKERDIDYYRGLHSGGHWEPYDFKTTNNHSELEKLKKRVDSLKSVKSLQLTSIPVETAAKNAIRSIKGRIAGLQQYYDLIDKSFKTEGKIMALLGRYVNARFNKVSSTVTNSDDVKGKETLKREQDNLKRKVKKP
jgi:hypothetical protein